MLAGLVAWGMAPQAGQVAPPAAAQNTARAVLLGRVVDADTGQPVGDAVVTVIVRPAGSPPAAPNARSGGPGTNQLRVLTTSEGRFVVRDVPAGAATLTVASPGYINASYGQTRPEGPAQTLTIDPGTRVREVTMRIWRSAALSGVITNDAGEPLPGVMVRAMRRGFTRGQPTFTARNTQQTDDRGVFRLGGLTPGDYIVSVPQTMVSGPAGVMDGLIQAAMQGNITQNSAAFMEMALSGGAMASVGIRMGDMIVGTQSGGVPQPDGKGGWRAYASRYAPGVDVSSAATMFTLKSGEERAGVNVTLPLLPTVTISGVVMGPTGPAANIGVRLRHAAESMVVDAMSDVAAATTRADGSFLMAGVPQGSYVLRVVRPARPAAPTAAQLAEIPEEMRASMAAMFAQSPNDNRTLFAQAPLTVERDVTDLAITLGAGATVAGRVEFQGAQAPSNLNQLAITLTPLSLDWTASGSAFLGQTGRVSDDGTFVTAGSPPGRYALTLQGGRAPSGFFLKSIVINGRDVTYDAFDLDDRDITGAVVTFTNRASALNGTVQAAAGAADAGATVVVFPAAWREWVSGGMNTGVLRVTRAAEAGTFTMEGLPPREYLVVAVSNTDAVDTQDPATFERLARVATAVTLGDGETRTVALRVQ